MSKTYDHSVLETKFIALNRYEEKDAINIASKDYKGSRDEARRSENADEMQTRNEKMAR